MASFYNNEKFYRSQFHRHLDAMFKGDGVSIEAIAERHDTLLRKAKALQALQPLLENIGKLPNLPRTSEGGFRELSLYRSQVESLKSYISNFPLEKLTIIGYADMERSFQLDLTNRLLQLDTFHQSMLVTQNIKELISGAIMGDKDLSLADMQLI
jgi:hypothetical protein